MRLSVVIVILIRDALTDVKNRIYKKVNEIYEKNEKKDIDTLENNNQQEIQKVVKKPLPAPKTKKNYLYEAEVNKELPGLPTGKRMLCFDQGNTVKCFKNIRFTQEDTSEEDETIETLEETPEQTPEQTPTKKKGIRNVKKA